MFNRVNRMEIFIDQFLRPHVTSYLSAQRVRRPSPNCVEVKIERANWLRAKSRPAAVRLIPTYTVRSVVSAKSHL